MSQLNFEKGYAPLAEEVFAAQQAEEKAKKEFHKDLDREFMGGVFQVLMSKKSLPVWGILCIEALGMLNVGVAHASESVNHTDLTEGFRPCGYREFPHENGAREFFQVANIGFQGDGVNTKLINTVEPGLKGYVYPGIDGQVKPGDQVAGYYQTCEAIIRGAAVIEHWYYPIDSGK